LPHRIAAFGYLTTERPSGLPWPAAEPGVAGPTLIGPAPGRSGRATDGASYWL